MAGHTLASSRACPVRSAGVSRWSTPSRPPLRPIGVGRTGPQAVAGAVQALRAGRPADERAERTQTTQCAAALTARDGQTGEPSSGRPSALRSDWGAPKRPQVSSAGLRGGSVSDTGGLLRASRGAEDKRGSRRRTGQPTVVGRGKRAGSQAIRRCQTLPNKGVQLTGNSVRSFVAPAIPSS
jgi:hypothetical protein